MRPAAAYGVHGRDPGALVNLQVSPTRRRVVVQRARLFFFALRPVPRMTALCLLLSAACAGAAPAPPPDPLTAETFGAAYLWRGFIWTTDQPRGDYWGARVIGQIGVGRIGITMRADVAGLPSSFDVNDPATFQSMEGYLAIHWNVVATQAGAVIGPSVYGGKALSLEAGGGAAPTTGAFTMGAGIRVAGRIYGQGAAAYLGLGTHEALGGLCVMAAAHLPITSRLFAMVDGAVTSGGRAFVRMNMGVVLAQ